MKVKALNWETHNDQSTLFYQTIIDMQGENSVNMSKITQQDQGRSNTNKLIKVKKKKKVNSAFSWEHMINYS